MTDAAAETTDVAAETTDVAAETTDVAAETTDLAADTTDLAADTADAAVVTTDPAEDTKDPAVGTTDVAADDAALVEVPLVGSDAPTHASQTRRLEEEGEVAADYLEELLDIADLDGDIDIDVDHGRAAVAIVAEDGSERWLRRLVGADGEVLDALQELTRLAVQTKTGERSRLMLDIAGFREGRRVELTALAEVARQQGADPPGRVSRETTDGDPFEGSAAGRDGVTTSRAAAEESAPGVGHAGDVSRETTASDPLEGSAVVRDFFGPAFPAVATLVAMLEREGVERGLIGPRELGKLWERNALNSAAAVTFLPTTGRLIDVGSGAGFPGLVLAAMRPDQEVVLVEPMERRTLWLAEAVAACGLANVVVTRARAEDLVGVLSGRGVTARAVAPLDRLAR